MNRAERRCGAAELFLGVLTAYAPSRALLEIRYRREAGGLGRFFLPVGSPRAAGLLVALGQRTDVYVGVAPRATRGGGREHTAPAALLWADCDNAQAAGRALASLPPPSVVVSSGSEGHVHAYWPLTARLAIDELEDANRRLGLALEADLSCADAARILRVPGTRSFKGEGSVVRLLRYSPVRHRPGDLLATLPAELARGRSRSFAARTITTRPLDPLQLIEPEVYVERLTGRRPGRDRKIQCPLVGHPDPTPSFHVYSSSAQGWTCFGCRGSDGHPRGGDIYTLASLLWLGGQAGDAHVRGRQFIALRERLDSLFGITRGGRSM